MTGTASTDWTPQYSFQRLSVAICSAALALAVASPAAARECGPTDAVIASLTGRYGEAVIAQGIMGDNAGNVLALMQTYVNAATGTWTVLVTMPNGQSCMAASGGTFEAIAAAKPGALN